MIPAKKPQNPSKFNSMAQIQVKCVKLTKPANNSKSNRSNSSLNLTSPPQSKERPEDLHSINQKLQSINTSNGINLSSTPKNYFLLANHNPASTSRSKTLHHSKMNLTTSHNNDQLNDSNKENYGQKCASPMQTSLGFFSRTPREETHGVKNSMNSRKGNEENILSHRGKLGEYQMGGIRENEEEFAGDEKKEGDKKNGEFFCLRHPTKKAKYFIQEKGSSSSRNHHHHLDNIVFCCSKCAIDLASQGKKIHEVNDELHESPSSSDNFSGIPEENSKNTIVDELCDNVMEVDAYEISKRDVDLSKFIKKLQNLKQESLTAFEQLNSRKKDVIFFYDKQIIKMDQIYNSLLRVIEKEKNQSTAKLKQFMSSTTANFNSMIFQLDSNIKDMTFIFNDIEQNRSKILRQMETDPFNLILSKYEEKLASYQAFSQNLYIEKLLLEKMTNSSIKIYQKKIDEVLSPNIASLFSTFEVSTSYLKKDVSIESESPIPLEKNLPKYNVFNKEMAKAPNENNSIYISFENKEMFENAIRTSLSNNGLLKAPNPTAILDLSANKTYNEIFCPEILNNPFQQVPSDISKHSEQKHSSSSKSNTNTNTTKEQDFLTTPKSNDKGIREFNSAQPGKLMNNLNKESSNKIKNKRFQSTDKLQNKKYLTLLEKVNNNQNNTNVFYSNIMQTNAPMTSPPIEKSDRSCEVKGIFQSLDHRVNLFEFMGKTSKPSESTKTGNVNILQPSPFKAAQNKEIKNYEGFFNFIENKLQDDCDGGKANNLIVGGANNNGGSYQKTLFCSSPHFKDV